MWQARPVRWRWRRLARMLGLYVSDPTQTVMQVFVGERGQWASPPRPRILIPRIRIKADAYGVIVRVRTLPKVGRDEWIKASPHLANAWGCVRVAVTQDGPGRLIVRAVRRDPLTEPYVYRPTGEPPPDLEPWEVGRDEYAQPTALRLSNVPGISIAGQPGYGKTSLVNGLIARLAPSPAVQLVVVDGAPYVSEADVARICASMAGLTRDPAELLSEAARQAPVVPGFREVGPTRGGDRSVGPWTDPNAENAGDAA